MIKSQLIDALAATGFKVHERWSYPPYPEPFTVPFWDGAVEVVIEFENPDGLVVTGPQDTVRRLQQEFERLGHKSQ